MLLLSKCWLVAVICFFGWSENLSAQSEKNKQDSVLNYGELVFDDAGSEGSKSHVLDLSYGFDSSDPLLDTGHVSLTYRHVLYEYFLLGITGRKFHSDKSPLLKSIEGDLDLVGAEVEAEQPDYSYYALIGLMPLKGSLNLFSSKVIEYRLFASVGVGERVVLGGEAYSGYVLLIDSVFMWNQSWGLSLVYNLESEAAFQSRKTVNRDQINVGLVHMF
ncbi:MAG: hypothetical protein HRT45_19690 [Bdellovibrionales bacterium]|nr:hypothetical protein [Bdellovibrionales bacterium]